MEKNRNDDELKLKTKPKNPDLPFRLRAVRDGRCRITLGAIVLQEVGGRNDLKKGNVGADQVIARESRRGVRLDCTLSEKRFLSRA
jgi:hypothetical protein